MSSYLKRLRAAVESVEKVLKDEGFKGVKFGGAGAEPAAAARLPTDARSEFFANRALGDWAEKSLAAAIRKAFPDLGIAHYGQSDTIAAGDEGFKEFYLAGREEVRVAGKRPDLLLFANDQDIKAYDNFDISRLASNELDKIARKAIGSIEVRSSKLDALHYMAVRRADLLRGKKSTREVPSFTVKVEDLVIVYRWIERMGLPQAYAQVFFDSAWAMDFADIFEWIGSTDKLKVENPDKSQGKATILIPITAGEQIASFIETPQHEVIPKRNRLGRHDTYLQPIFKPNALELDKGAFERVVLKHAIR
jgi:hypothetical protein